MQTDRKKAVSPFTKRLEQNLPLKHGMLKTPGRTKSPFSRSTNTPVIKGETGTGMSLSYFEPVTPSPCAELKASILTENLTTSEARS